jgi:hypothetical protein
MQALRYLQDDSVIPVGSILRVYNVRRFDLEQRAAEDSTITKEELDFYDYVLVDCSVLKPNVFALVNVTTDNNNRGKILALLPIGARMGVTASDLKNYFGDVKVSVEVNI